MRTKISAPKQFRPPDLEPARLSIELLTGDPATPVQWQVFHDRGVPGHAWTAYGTLDDLAPRLIEAQRRGCGVYITVNETDGRGRRASNVRKARASFVDLDGTPLPDAWALPPHMIVETSPGKFQSYWFLDDGDDLAAWSDIQARLATFYGADPSVIDPPRVLRVPGFWHLKGKPFQTRIVEHADPESIRPVGFMRYLLSDVTAKHPCDYKRPAPRVQSEAQEPASGWDNESDVERAVSYLQDEAPLAIEGEHGDDTTFKVAAALRDLGLSEFTAYELMLAHWNDRCAPPWSDKDLERKVRNAFEYAQNAPGVKSVAGDFADPPTPGQRVKGLTIYTAAEVEPQPIRWSWPGRFAMGKLGLIAGHPDQGKSQITCDMAARVTTGAVWPDGSGRAEIGSVLFLSAEDDVADTIRPRLEATGADLAKCYFINALVETKDGKRMLNLGDDLNRLAAVLEGNPGIRLVVIDPISAYLGGKDKADTYKNTEVRAMLAPVADWAARYNVAVVFVSHFNKSGTGRALSRVTDSLAFTALARSVWLTIPEENESGPTGRSLFLRGKLNIAKDPGGLAYKIEGVDLGDGINAPRVVWDGPVNITADQAMEQVGRKFTAVEAAETFLTDLLADGPVLRDTIKSKAESNHHSWRTVERAKTNLKIRTLREGGFAERDKWRWCLLDREGPTELFEDLHDDDEQRAS